MGLAWPFLLISLSLQHSFGLNAREVADTTRADLPTELENDRHSRNFQENIGNSEYLDEVEDLEEDNDEETSNELREAAGDGEDIPKNSKNLEEDAPYVKMDARPFWHCRRRWSGCSSRRRRTSAKKIWSRVKEHARNIFGRRRRRSK